MSVTPAQKALLVEIATTVNRYGEEGLYVSCYSRYGRTVRALIDRGLVKVDRPDYSGSGQDGYIVTEAGRALVDRWTVDG